MAKVTYVCERAPTLTIRLGKTRFRFENKQLVLDSDAAVLMDEAIVRSVHVKQLVKKVDMEAAEAIALAHIASKKAQAVNGPFNSESFQSNALHERDAALAESRQMASREDVLAIRRKAAPDIESDIMLTEGVKDAGVVPAVESREGFVPAVTADDLQKSATKAAAISTLLSK